MTDAASTSGITRPDLLDAALAVSLPSVMSSATLLSAGHARSFHQRLRDMHDYTETSAHRLEFEYRRFLYLKAVHGGNLTPSAVVDEAWHLHFQTPGLDWDAFCDELAGRRLGYIAGLTPVEREAGYARTRALYRSEFGAEPPRDIWPDQGDTRRGALLYRMMATGIVSLLLGIVAVMLGELVGGAWAPLGTAGWVLCVGGMCLAFLSSFVFRGPSLEIHADSG